MFIEKTEVVNPRYKSLVTNCIVIDNPAIHYDKKKPYSRMLA